MITLRERVSPMILFTLRLQQKNVIPAERQSSVRSVAEYTQTNIFFVRIWKTVIHNNFNLWYALIVPKIILPKIHFSLIFRDITAIEIIYQLMIQKLIRTFLKVQFNVNYNLLKINRNYSNLLYILNLY